MRWKEFHWLSSHKAPTCPEFSPKPLHARVKLPEPRELEMPLGEAIRRRRTRRDISSQVLSLQELADILFYSGGVTGQLSGYPLRAIPSAGARHSAETFVVARAVEGLEQGVYRYDWQGHSLEGLWAGDYSQNLYSACMRQEFVRDAPVNLVLASAIERQLSRYGERGYRYAVMDVAFAAEHVHLVCESLGLATVIVGAFYDDAVHDLLQLGRDFIIFLLMSVGRKRPWN